MKISKLNFKYLYPQISKTLSNSQYISMDFEFSGTSMRKELVNTRFDDPYVRYYKLKENIKNFIPLQIGLCGIESLPNTHKINLYPMNFYIFPYLNENSDKKLIFDIGSINFLTSNSFDFNKTFYDGIRFISLAEYNQAKKDKVVRDIIKSKREKKHFPPEARLLTMTFYPKLKQFIDNFLSRNLNYDHVDNYIEFEVTFVRKILIEYFLSNLNTLFKVNDKNIIFEVEVEECNIQKTLLKIRITNENLLKEKSLRLANERDYKKISSWIYYQSLVMNESESENASDNDNENETNSDFNINLWKNILINIISNDKLKKGEISNLGFDIDIDINKENKKILNEVEINSNNYDINEAKKILSLSGKNLNYDSPLLKIVTKAVLGLDKIDDTYKIGFTKVIADLIKLKKPLILHNGILDLMQLVDKFIAPLPEHFDDFKNIVNETFPKIYDTKYLIENNSSLFSTFQDSSLESVSKKIMKEKMLKGVHIEIGEEDSEHLYSADYKIGIENTTNTNNGLNMKSHEAGYDAMTTSYAFLYIYKDLFKNLSLLSDNQYSDSCLQIFKNKLLFSGLQTPCDLNPSKPLYNITNTNNNANLSEPRFDIFVLSELPDIISTEEIKNCFKLTFNVSPQVYKLFGQNIAYVIFTSSSQKKLFLKSVEIYQTKNLNTDLLGELPLLGYDRSAMIIPYKKFIQSLKNYSQKNLDKILSEIELEA